MWASTPPPLLSCPAQAARGPPGHCRSSTPPPACSFEGGGRSRAWGLPRSAKRRPLMKAPQRRKGKPAFSTASAGDAAWRVLCSGWMLLGSRFSPYPTVFLCTSCVPSPSSPNGFGGKISAKAGCPPLPSRGFRGALVAWSCQDITLLLLLFSRKQNQPPIHPCCGPLQGTGGGEKVETCPRKASTPAQESHLQKIPTQKTPPAPLA